VEYSKYDFCIIGAGPSGLTLAYKLLQGGCKVLVMERDSRAGGLAKSFNYDGHIFDVGPKRFHTDDPIVVEFINQVMDMVRIKRSTEVYFLEKFFEWPLNAKDIFRMPINISLKSFFDMITKKEIKDPNSFHEYVASKYGETLYSTFFEPYTRKFLRWDPENIHADWASTGINRAVIDKKLENQTSTLFDLVKSLMLPSKVETEFLYPGKGGFGGFYEELLTLCNSYDGFKILYEDTIDKLDDNNHNFSALTRNEKTFYFDELIWSGNLNDLLLVINKTDNKVHYLNTIFYNLICKENGIGQNRAQWIYVSDGESLISRITCMKEFSPYTCKEGYYNLICELTDSQGAPVYFKNPKKYTQQILDELISMSFLKGTKFVEDVKINPIIDTYPIYSKNYIEDFTNTVGTVKKFSKRIHFLGRCGAFWYNNSDHSIRFAISLSEKLLGKSDKEFDYRNYFGGNHGRSTSPKGS